MGLVLLNFRILVFVRVSPSMCVWPAPALRRLVYRV